MIKKIVWNIVIISFMFSLVHSETLLDSYKKRMQGAKASTTLAEEASSTPKNIINEIQTIESMKKSTFESTDDFERRRDQAINKLNDKMTFYFKRGAQEYSAGTVQMNHYNPDTQMMTVTFKWNKPLTSLLSDTDLLRTASFNIEREKAKKLFSGNKKQFFHIRFMHLFNKITLSKILLYNEYLLYKSVYVKRTPTFKNVVNTKPYTEQKIQDINKKQEVLSSKYIIKNKTNNVEKVIKDKKHTESIGDFWIILILIIITIAFLLKYISSVKKTTLNNENTSNTKSQKISSPVVNKKLKNVYSEKNMSVNINYSKKLHELVEMYKIKGLVYKKTKISKNKIIVEILHHKKVIAKVSASSQKEAKQMAAKVAIDKMGFR